MGCLPSGVIFIAWRASGMPYFVNSMRTMSSVDVGSARRPIALGSFVHSSGADRNVFDIPKIQRVPNMVAIQIDGTN